MKLMRAALKRWRLLLPISWMVIIFLLSGEAFASLPTSTFLIPILHSLWPNLSYQVLIQLHALLRKAAHFLEYLLLSYLWYWSLRPHRGMGNQASSLALTLSLAYALFDEIHQSLLPSRTGSFRDLLIDGAGAFLMQAILWFRLRRQKARAGAGMIGERAERGT